MITNDMNIRLKYHGGSNQQVRMNKDKLRGLRKALLYSYQAATIVLNDGREFRGLINPDKNSNDYDQKELSIPFEDICINSESFQQDKTSNSLETIGIKPGDVFTWKENNTDWLVYLHYNQETAYFRAAIRKCEAIININGIDYKAYVRGPVETNIDWAKAESLSYNKLNYSLLMYITADENTLPVIQRHAKIKVYNINTHELLPYEVQAVDRYGGDGIIEATLLEDYTNSMDEYVTEVVGPDIDKSKNIYIDGKTLVYPYDVLTYTAVNATNGSWSIDDKHKVKVISENNNEITVEIIYSKSSEKGFNLTFTDESGESITQNIRIDTL